MNDELRLICTFVILICTTINLTVIIRDAIQKRRLKRINKEMRRMTLEQLNHPEEFDAENEEDPEHVDNQSI